jgi:hypothetical protein
VPVIGFPKPSDKPSRRYSSDPKTRAAELVKDGKIGGKREGAGRPRKSTSDSQKPKRASTVVAEALRENAELVASVIPDVVNDPDASRHMKLRAAKLAVDIEGKEAERLREEDERLGRFGSGRGELPADRDALVETLAAKVAGNPMLAAELGAALTRAAAQAGVEPQTAQTDARGPEIALNQGD